MAWRVESLLRSEHKEHFVQLSSRSTGQVQLAAAKECLTRLDHKLAEHRTLFMFGSEAPSLIDAYLYAYLSVLSRAPFKSSPLKVHSTNCSHLASLVSRIQIDKFPAVRMNHSEKMGPAKKLSWFSSLSSRLPLPKFIANRISSSSSSSNENPTPTTSNHGT